MSGPSPLHSENTRVPGERQVQARAAVVQETEAALQTAADHHAEVDDETGLTADGQVVDTSDDDFSLYDISAGDGNGEVGPQQDGVVGVELPSPLTLHDGSALREFPPHGGEFPPEEHEWDDDDDDKDEDDDDDDDMEYDSGDDEVSAARWNVTPAKGDSKSLSQRRDDSCVRERVCGKRLGVSSVTRSVRVRPRRDPDRVRRRRAYLKWTRIRPAKTCLFDNEPPRVRPRKTQ